MGSYAITFYGQTMDFLFPAPLEAWGVSYGRMTAQAEIKDVFPAPLEAWVVSYDRKKVRGRLSGRLGFRPLSRLG